MAKLTPMMAQYRKIKAEYNDCILMFRLGDFYEMFFEDAQDASKILQITLTARGKSENKTPMCGIPFHALDQYLWKLTQAGKKVALCDQITKPDGKGIVEREVTRVVTPGTTFDERLIQNNNNNFVSAISEENGKFALAYADLTTGAFRVTEIQNLKALHAEMARVSPTECICSDNLLNSFDDVYTFPYSYAGNPSDEIIKFFGVHSLSVFGMEDKALAQTASAMLLQYIIETQKTNPRHILKISYYQTSSFMPLDESCIRNLELFHTTRGEYKEGTLLSVLDQTTTAMGGRLLRTWLLHPLVKKSSIEKRQNIVEKFVKDSTLLREIRNELSTLYDIERLLSKLSLGSGNARDLIALKSSLEKLPKIRALLLEKLPSLANGVVELPKLVEEISNAIMDEPAVSLRDGGIIRDGYNPELDDLRNVSRNGKSFIKNLQETEIARTGISSLKVKFNRVFGYYIEISRANLDSVPENYIRKQTLVNAERFITPELKEYEEKVLTAEDSIKEIEYELFYQVRMRVLEEIAEIKKTASTLAKIDVLSTFAFDAEMYFYVKPNLVEENLLSINGGRHAVVEKLRNDFVPNDTVLDDDNNFILLTGPNMGGKSTYLRQIALIVLMAQIGSYVPADEVYMSVVDRIFTRVGASDNLSKGESTFMVEMQEASYILNHATAKSLIIFDEIGRGTSTYDGVSLAWAILEYIQEELHSKTLFATHYHELIELADNVKNTKNMSVAVRKNDDDGVVFLYKVLDGGENKSYGIEVAKLAGMPKKILNRSKFILNTLEQKSLIVKGLSDSGDNVNKETTKGILQQEKRASGLHSFASENEAKRAKKILEEVQNLDINDLTPLQALQILNNLSTL